MVNPEYIWCIEEVGVSEGYNDKSYVTWHQIEDSKVKVRDVRNPKIHHSLILMVNNTGP